MSQERPTFLITNDDGFHSPGILYLWQAVKDFADVVIIAPDKEKSGSGASLTIDTLKVTPVSTFGSTEAYKVSGTPVDCIKVGLSVVLKKAPTMILSGINHGTNSGRAILFSGTVGGVIEGVLRNIPGVAFSYWRYDTDAFAHIKKYIWPIVQYLSSQEIPKGSFYNVNFPGHHEQEIKGLKVVPHGHSNWTEKPTWKKDPEGHVIYNMNGEWVDHFEPEGTDVHYLKQGYITASPIHVAQLTDFSMLQNHKEDFEKNFDHFFSTQI